jgi:hypothetical protein
MMPPIVELADEVLGSIAHDFAGKTGTVVIKHPHTMLTPGDWQASFGSRGHRRIMLIRNPLMRLNGMLWRKQHGAIGPSWDLGTFHVFARRWLSGREDERVTYEQLRHDPRSFFARIYAAWGWQTDATHLDGAVAYAQSKYHDASAHIFAKADPTKGVVSERQRALPCEAIDAYLGDALVQEVAAVAGWNLSQTASALEIQP